MALVDVIKDPTRRQLRQFGGMFLPGFLAIVGAIVLKGGRHPTAAFVLFGVAGVSVVTALARPALLGLPFVGLQYVAYPFGWVLSHALMAVVYFGVVTPVGLLVRTFKGDPLKRRIDPNATTYWVSRKGTPRIERYFRQY